MSASVTQCDLNLEAVDMTSLGCDPSTVGTLNLSENRLKAPANVHLFPKVHTLILDKNGLPGLQGFQRSASVRQLWFNNNGAEDLAEFLDQVCDTYPNVTWLSFMRNPASPPMVLASEEDVAACERYRLYVVYRIPKLTMLDAQPVTAKERVDAAAKGQYMVARKPRPGAYGAGTAAAAASASSGTTLFGMMSGGSSAATAAAAAAAPPPSKKPTAYLAVGRQEYNGKNSEGNRFIRDSDL